MDAEHWRRKYLRQRRLRKRDKRFKEELEECVASLREQVLALRVDLAAAGDRRFRKTKSGRVYR